jgi:glycosyl transferase family 2
MVIRVGIVHAVPGRCRLRVVDGAVLRRIGPRLRAFLEAQPGVLGVRIDPSSRSVVVRHEGGMDAETVAALVRTVSADELERVSPYGVWLHHGGTAKVAAVVPARNEETTVGGVAAALGRASLVDEVLVVDNASTDATADVAASAGARVVTCTEVGKGEAMRAGAAATDADVLLFADADLLGILPEHADALVGPVLEGRVAMACGLFDRGSLNPVFLHGLPVLTGQRALTRRLFESLDAATVAGYRVEAAINERCRELGLPTVHFVCRGLWHRTKERKHPTVAGGMAEKLRMLLVAGRVYVRRPVQHLLGEEGP